jgi:hypothetical protein
VQVETGLLAISFLIIVIFTLLAERAVAQAHRYCRQVNPLMKPCINKVTATKR